MASVNKAIIVGRLGRDPEVRYSPDGAAICNISLATESTWKDKASGERRSETEWHRIVFYNRLAEIAGEYLRKGREVYVEGRIKTRKWADKETGQDRYSTEIIGDQMQMLGGRDDDGGQREAPQRTAPQRQPQAQQQAAPQSGSGGFGDMSDDIPFMRHGHGAMWRAI